MTAKLLNLVNAGFAIGEVIKFVVSVVEEVFVKPKSGPEKKAAAIALAKQMINDAVNNLEISDWWKKILKSVLNWDFILGFLIDKIVAMFNEMGIFKHSEG